MTKVPRNRLAATAGYLTLAAVDSYLAGHPAAAARRARFVTKPLLMPALAASTALADPGAAEVAGSRSDALPRPSNPKAIGLLRGVQVAQVFSWGGDLALLGRSRTGFLAGVGSFALAHAAYISGFLAERDDRASFSSPGVRAGAATWVAAAPVMALAAGRKDAALPGPVAAYAGILTGMFATSTLLTSATPQRARRRIVAGTSLFLLSDTLLAVQKFLRSEPSPALESAVMATYTSGQWLIAEGALAARR